jgi:NAD(P)-dependent dehydrogenase (short-subunit alcohol dehydrogenase family)
MNGPRRFDLSGKVAVVTGGAGIIGTAACRGLAEHGAKVAVVDLDGPGAGRLAEDIAGGAGAALGVECDVTDPDSVASMVDRVEKALGPIDVLHNNAAGKSSDLKAFFAPFEDYSLDVWREITAVNLDGMFLVAQAVGRRMVARGRGGSLIQTGSIYGLVGPEPSIYEGSEYMGVAINTPAVYAATKAGVIGLTRYLATYWAPQGIRVNALVPGGVESGQNETFQAAYGARTPLGRMAKREEMVGAVVFLASDAASYVTGQVLAVDGGWTAW